MPGLAFLPARPRPPFMLHRVILAGYRAVEGFKRMSGWIAALLVTVLGLAITAVWFGINRRRQAEAELGVQSLARLKWRESIAVVLEALQREGYSIRASATSEGTETMLDKGRDKVLLDYKHGTAYCLGESSVREFAAQVRMRGAHRGILATLGTLEAGAGGAAAAGDILLIDGPQLWSMVRPFLSDAMLASISNQASAATRKGWWKGVAASILAGAVVYLGSQLLQGPGSEAKAVTGADAQASGSSVNAPAQSAPAQDAMLRQLNATAAAMAEVEKLTPQQLVLRRASAAKQVAQLAQVNTAAWSAQRTLLLTLNSTDGKDQKLIEEVCRILLQNEEMRYTRIQLDPPEGSTQAVRWRLCE